MKKNLHSFLITIILLFCLQAFSNPVISAVSVSNITPNSARINFSVTAQNSTTYAFVQINTTPTMSGSYPPNGPFNGTTPIASFQDVTNLIPNTLYYYAIDAYNASSQAAATITGTFTTGGTVPSTTNAVVSNITSTSAQIDFEVNTFGIQSSIVVDYGLSPTFFYSYNWVANTFTTTPTPFSFNFTELTPNTTYYYSVGAYSPTLTGNRIVGNFTTSVLSTSDPEQKLNFSVSPNPASDHFTIEMENEVQSVEMYSLQGQKVLTSNSKNIDVSAVSNGIYFIRITDENNAIATQKLLIK